MKYLISNLRNNDVAIYEDLERAKRFIEISIMLNNQDKKANEEKWTKNDFQIMEVK